MRTKFGLLVVSIFVIALSLIGCGGGGGGSNPVAPAISPATASLSGSVMMNGRPMANTAVYLYKSSAARNAGVAKLASAKASLKASSLAQTLGTDGSYFTTSDMTGRYSFTNIPVGEYTLIAVKDENHQFARPNIMLGSVTTVDAQLTPTGTITGHVIMTSGSVTENITGAMVYLEGTSYVALTDGSGNFTISHVPASQTFSLGIQSAKGMLSTAMSVELAPAENSNLGDIILTANTSNDVTLTGQLQWSDTTQTESFEGFMIGLLNNQTKELSFTMADASGNFGFIVAASGTYTTAPMGRIHDDNGYDNTPDHQTVTVDLSSSEVALPQPFVLSGNGGSNNKNNVWGSIDKDPRLLDESDNSGVPVTIVPTGSSSGPQMTVVTDSAGGFNFYVADGQYNLVIGGRYTFANTFTNPVSIATDTDLGAIKIKPSVDSAPTYIVSGVVNKTAKLSNELDNSGIIVTLAPTSASGHSLSTVTRADGGFFFEVASGTYTINITGDYEPIAALPNPVVVDSDIDLAIINVAPNSTTAGSVEWSLSGVTATESYRVYLTNTSTLEEMYKGTSLGNNRVIFNNIYPGTYTLSVKPVDNGYSGQTVPFFVHAGENVVMSPISLTLVAPVITNATVTPLLEINGNRLATSSIAFVDGSRLEKANYPANWNSGHIEFKAVNLRPGTYTLSLQNSDGTRSVNKIPLFVPLKRPTITSLKFTDTSVKATWNLGDFADKSRVELYNNAMAPVGASPWNIQQTVFEYKQLLPNATYTIRIRNGLGDIASNYVEQTFHTRDAGAYSSVLPKTVLAGSSFIDGSTIMAFGFEVVGNYYYIAGHNISNGDVYISRYDTTGARVASITVSSYYGATLDNCSMSVDSNGVYLLAYNSGGDMQQLRVFDAISLALVSGPINLDGTTYPDLYRGKIKAFGNYIIATGEDSTGQNEVAYAFDSSDITSYTTILTHTWGQTAPGYSPQTFGVMATADGTSLYVTEVNEAVSGISGYTIHKYDLATLTFSSGSDIVIALRGSLTDFVKATNNFIIGGMVSPPSSIEHYRLNETSGFAQRFGGSGMTSVGLDAQDRIWYQSRPDTSGGMSFARSTDGYNIDKSILVSVFANVDSSSKLGLPGEFIKLDKSTKQMNMLFRQADGNLAVYHYDSSY